MLCLPKAHSHTVYGVRVGAHKGYTRLVMDLDQKPDLKASLNGNATQLRLFMRHVRLKGRLPKIKNKLIDRLSFERLRKRGGALRFFFKRPIQVIKTFTIPASKKNRRYRYVMDIRERKAPPRPKQKKAPKVSRKKVVVIDPGHGGRDPGASGRRGILEKNVTLSAAKALRKKLEKSGRYRVILTRDRDVYLSLPQRIMVGRKNKADLFISLHADSHKRSDTRGLSVYMFSKVASDKEAEKLALKENAAGLMDGIELDTKSQEVADILIDLMKRETSNRSRKFSLTLVNKLRKRVLLLRNSLRWAAFRVLRTPDMPAALIEMGYISNRQDERILTTSRYRDKLCEGIKEAIDAYFLEHK